jgi:hypothetical protein
MTIDEVYDQEMRNEEDDGEDEAEPESIPTFAKAIEAMETVRQFITGHEVDESVMNAVIKMDSTIKELGLKTKKQSTLDRFFRPL